jgi:CheY-like chemotaxis protein
MTNSDVNIIWIVEDDLDDRILLNEAFKETGFGGRIFLFPDAISALQKLGRCSAEEIPAIIVTDYNMHVMNGAEFVESLCSHRRYNGVIKVILSTSSYLFDTAECLRKGADAYFVKPASYTELVDVASSILAVKKDKIS